MKRVFSFILLCLMVLGPMQACNKQAEQNKKGGRSASTEDRPYRLTVDGKPFVLIGAQLRMDLFRQLEKKQLNELDQYFVLAKSLNLTAVQVSISWSDIETSYDVYSDEVVKAFIDYCEKYQLKLELLWFGSYMCGYSVEGHLPAYVVDNPSDYPLLNEWCKWQGYQGVQYFLRPGTSKLVQRESKAIGKMMEFIAAYDKKLGSPHTVIGIQVENEPNMLATRHNNDHGFSPNDIWPNLLSHLNAIGKAVKNGPYKCYTRVNQTTWNEEWANLDECMYWCRKIVALEGIDYIGVDPYETLLPNIKEKIEKLNAIEGNYAHVAENGGEYFNNDLMALQSLVLGGGYEVFEVVTTKADDLKDYTLRGVYNTNFTQKPQTQQLIDAFGIFKDAWYDFATLPVKDMHGFNLIDARGQEDWSGANCGKVNTSEVVALSKGSCSWSTSNKGVAFILEGNSYLTAGSTKADQMNFNFNVRSAEEGFYTTDGRWEKKADANARLKGNILNMEPCKVYRISY